MSVLERAMTEDELLQAVTDALTLRGWLWTHHRRSDKALTMGTPGIPDLVAVRRDRLLFVELKTMKGKPTPNQDAWLTALMGVAYRRGAPETWLVKPDRLDWFLESIA